MSENECIIDLDTSTKLAKGWINQVNSKLENLTKTSSGESERWKKQSIYRVPSSLTEWSKEAYKPQTVSIGPYHHNKKRLKAMDVHKQRAFLQFLSRSEKPLGLYVNALAKVVDHLKDAYDQLNNKWRKDSNEAFLKMMIVDGCFILELLRTTTATPKDWEQMGYKENDPVFSNHGKLNIVPYLKRDMLMLENQLPMLVLTRLVAVEKGKQTQAEAQDEVIELILKFFPKPHDMSKIEQPDNCLHILDVYRKILLSFPDNHKNQTTESSHGSHERLGKCLHILDVWRKSLLLFADKLKTRTTESSHKGNQHHQRKYDIIRTATELREAGVRIKPSETRSLKDVSFHRGVLRLPHIVVDEILESDFMNLVAFERLHVGAGNEVTSYIIFMDHLIDSGKDVSLLHSYGIIDDALGSHRYIAFLFNSPWKVSKHIMLDSSGCLHEVHLKISEYCQKPGPRWRASLRHNYCTNPWMVLSVTAAIVLFALTGIQTVYAVLCYDPSK